VTIDRQPPQTKAQLIGASALDIPVWQPRFFSQRQASGFWVRAGQPKVALVFGQAEPVHKALSNISVAYRTRSARKKVAVWFCGP
jgi:hypothetical protein